MNHMIKFTIFLKIGSKLNCFPFPRKVKFCIACTALYDLDLINYLNIPSSFKVL